MDLNLIKQLKKLGSILKNSTDYRLIFESFIEGVSNIFEADVAFIDLKGCILKEVNKSVPSFGIKNRLTDEVRIEAQLISQLNNVNDYKINITLDNLYTTVIDKYILKNSFGIFLPIFIASEKLGNFMIYKKGSKFLHDVEPVCEYISAVLGILTANNRNTENAEEERKISTIKSAIATLSYSELEAILNIFDELDGEEGLLVASKVADKAGITRSVIVNALRKFESAGVIESRSLGMKGTHIRVLNKYLIEELNKFKK